MYSCRNEDAELSEDGDGGKVAMAMNSREDDEDSSSDDNSDTTSNSSQDSDDSSD